MTGVPFEPEDVTLNRSVTQSPIAPPSDDIGKIYYKVQLGKCHMDGLVLFENCGAANLNAEHIDSENLC